MNSRGLLIFPIFFILLSLGAYAAEETKKSPPDLPVKNIYETNGPQVDVVADTLEYSRDQKKIIAKNNVVVRYGDTYLTSDYAEVETAEKKAYARGHVFVFKKGQTRAQGNEINYDFGNETGNFPDGRMINFPWYTKGDDIQQVRKGVKKVVNGKVTTCDLENPHYYIQAKRITIYDNDKLIARNVTIYVLGKPIFWWPYLIIPLHDAGNLPFALSAGYRSEFGYYLEASKGFSITKEVGGKFHFDWRSKRGFGSGVDLYYDYQKFGRGIFQTYLTQDHNAPNSGGGSANDFQDREDRLRGRVTYRHRTDLDPYSNIQLRYNRLADEHFLQEFFEKEYRSEVEPQSFVTLTKNSDRYGFLTHVEKRMNYFEALVERMPEIRFDWKNQPFLKPWLFYENQYSFANLAKRFSRSSMNEDVVRFDGFNEWSAPLQWKTIKFTPFTNLRGTYYSRDREASDKQFRTALGFGADLRTQSYKTYPVTFEKFGIEVNQLRHVIEPSIQYRSTKSSVSDETLNHFDSIDKIDDADVITFGVENRLQTKRVVHGRTQRVDIVSLNTFLSYELNPDGVSSSPVTVLNQEVGDQTASAFTILNQEVVLRPYEWLQYESRFDFDLTRDVMRVFSQDLIARKNRWRFLVGQRYVRDISTINGNNQFVGELDYTINSRWKVGGYTRWDPSIGALQEWQIYASRDMHDFILDFGYNVRNSAIRSANREVFFNFRLKAYEMLGVRSGGQRATFSSPRIGETVAGSSQAPTVPMSYYDGQTQVA